MVNKSKIWKNAVNTSPLLDPVGFNAECVHFNHNFCSESWVITENGENASKLS